MGYIGVYNPLILTFYQHFRPGISNSPTTIPWPSWLVPPKLCLRWASVSGFRVSPPHGDVVSVFITARLVGRHGQSWASDVCNIWGGIIPIIFFACSTASHFSHWKKKGFHGMIWINTIFMFSSHSFNSNIYQNWLWQFHIMMLKKCNKNLPTNTDIFTDPFFKRLFVFGSSGLDFNLSKAARMAAAPSACGW